MFAVQKVLTDIQNGAFPEEGQAITKEKIHAHLKEALEAEPRENNLTLGENGRKATYFLGKFAEDPDAEIMLDRATHIIMHNLHHIQNAKSEQDAVDALYMDDLIYGAAQSDTVDPNADPELMTEILGTKYEMIATLSAKLTQLARCNAPHAQYHRA